MLKIKAACGHAFLVNRDLRNIIGVTLDCPECGELLVVPSDEITVPKFHQYMHDKGPDPKTGFQWPADGVNTGWVDVPGV